MAWPCTESLNRKLVPWLSACPDSRQGCATPGWASSQSKPCPRESFAVRDSWGCVEPSPQRGNGRLELEVHRRHRQMALAVGRQRWERICGPCERGITTFNLHGAHVRPDRVFPCRRELVHTGLRRPHCGVATRGQRQPTRALSGQLPSVRGHGPCQRGRCRFNPSQQGSRLAKPACSNIHAGT